MRLLHRFSLITLIAIYVLILVGGIVRSTGSGMGCPDWPKCMGRWIPPTDESQLPENYKDYYSSKRAEKNVKFAKYLRAFGFEESANRILNDESILFENDFNKYKTWVEYINRLTGVVIGFCILITCFFSLRLFKESKTIAILGTLSLILTVFQAWFGSIVVSTKLVPWTITIHMFLAILIVAFLIYLYFISGRNVVIGLPGNNRTKIKALLIACMVIGVVQIFLGTQVREAIDVIAAQMGAANRDSWIGALGMEFIIHRTFSWLVLILHGLLLFNIMKNDVKSKLGYGLMSVVLLSILTGVVMAYFGIPAFIQPVHLLLGTLIFGLEFLLFLQFSVKDKGIREY
ncbi:COX15/CtaA family protein [Fulvivirga maritima]|uniref:COX15/CtaA family protein n=1 Tax=Fulvivirga maritima TaxID=2904247 RepID=UPI001F1710C6|nr:COX15/CtaA family protein [Fulvivirga maritima]UII24794.1 COX15/CtaA family protein [Fulvivirga maritima]